jgi:hypothetical protein
MSEKIYRWLLKLYPASFREGYSAAALQLFRDRSRAERGVLRRLRFWADVITDLCISLPREHWRPKANAPAGDGSFGIPNPAARLLIQRDTLFPAVLVNLFVLIGWTIGWLGGSSSPVLYATYFPLAAMAVMRFTSVRRMQKRWQSYELVLEGDRIQQRDYCRDRTLLRGQIVKINEDQHGLTVVGQGAGRLSTIWIPAGLTGYREVRAQILQWCGQVSQRRSFWLRDLRHVFVCAASLLPAVVFVPSAPWLAVAAGIYYGMLALAILLYVVRPRRDSGLTQGGVMDSLPALPDMWSRFKQSGGNPAVVALLVLPVVRIVMAS